MSEPLARIARALGQLRADAGLTQGDVALRMQISRNTVAQQEAKGVESVVKIARFEQAVGVPAGTVLRHAGLIDNASGSVIEAIRADPELSNSAKEALTSTYAVMVLASGSQSTPTR